MTKLTLEEAATLLDTDTVLVERHLRAGSLQSLRRADVEAYKVKKDATDALMSEASALMEGSEKPRPIPTPTRSRPSKSADTATSPKPKF